MHAARCWDTELLGQKPYFKEPFYVGFSVGGLGPGLLPDGQTGTIDRNRHGRLSNIEVADVRHLELGVTTLAPDSEVGAGIKVAAVRIAFGNCFNIIENPNFDASPIRLDARSTVPAADSFGLEGAVDDSQVTSCQVRLL